MRAIVARAANTDESAKLGASLSHTVSRGAQARASGKMGKL